MSDVGSETGMASGQQDGPSIWPRQSRRALRHPFLTRDDRDEQGEAARQDKTGERDDASDDDTQPELTVWERLERLQAFSEA